MRTGWDALRSLRKYVAVCLGAEWEVRLAYEEGSFRRPFARVTAAGAAQLSGAAHTTDTLQPFSIVCHPAEQATIDASVREAERVRDLLIVAFRRGVSFTEGLPLRTVRGAPGRVPLWDYDAVALDATSTKRAHCDYMRIAAFSAEVLVDADDPMVRAVTADVRLGWRREGPVPGGPKTLRSLRHDFAV